MICGLDRKLLRVKFLFKSELCERSEELPKRQVWSAEISGQANT
jgi:hypothetical protein